MKMMMGLIILFLSLNAFAKSEGQNCSTLRTRALNLNDHRTQTQFNGTGDRLATLEKEHDQLTAQIKILQGLKKINDDYHTMIAALRSGRQKELADFEKANQFFTKAQKIVPGMRALNHLLEELKVDRNQFKDKDGQPLPFSDVIKNFQSKCLGKNKNALCQGINDTKAPHHQLVTSFLKAYHYAHHEHPKQKGNALSKFWNNWHRGNAVEKYLSILKSGVPESVFHETTNGPEQKIKNLFAGIRLCIQSQAVEGKADSIDCRKKKKAYQTQVSAYAQNLNKGLGLDLSDLEELSSMQSKWNYTSSHIKELDVDHIRRKLPNHQKTNAEKIAATMDIKREAAISSLLKFNTHLPTNSRNEYFERQQKKSQLSLNERIKQINDTVKSLLSNHPNLPPLLKFKNKKTAQYEAEDLAEIAKAFRNDKAKLMDDRIKTLEAQRLGLEARIRKVKQSKDYQNANQLLQLALNQYFDQCTNEDSYAHQIVENFCRQKPASKEVGLTRFIGDLKKISNHTINREKAGDLDNMKDNCHDLAKSMDRNTFDQKYLRMCTDIRKQAIIARERSVYKKRAGRTKGGPNRQNYDIIYDEDGEVEHAFKKDSSKWVRPAKGVASALLGSVPFILQNGNMRKDIELKRQYGLYQKSRNSWMAHYQKALWYQHSRWYLANLNSSGQYFGGADQYYQFDPGHSPTTFSTAGQGFDFGGNAPFSTSPITQ